MKISKDMQKDILLESFEILKINYEENYSEISETIGKMAAIDINTAMDMWEYILDSNPMFITDNAGYVNDNNAYGITSRVLSDIHENVGYSEVANVIKSRPKIKDAIFGQSANVDETQCSIIAEYISQGDLDTANEVLQLVNNNKNNKGLGFSKTLGGIFQRLIDELESDASDNSIEFLHHWIQQIKHPKEKAKASVRFLNLLK